MKILITSIISVFLFTSCNFTTNTVSETNKTQLSLRAIQTRDLEITDQNKLLRAIIATLQDLDFILTRVDKDLGVITANKANKHSLDMTVTASQKTNTQSAVRASARYKKRAIEDMKFYQDFFINLEKSLFLSSNNIS